MSAVIPVLASKGQSHGCMCGQQCTLMVLSPWCVLQVVAIPAAFTDLAACDYPGGMTCHRAFRLPVVTDGDDTAGPLVSSLTAEGEQAAVLAAAGLIVVDEAPMSGRKVVDAARALLKDVVDVHGPAARTIILSGDFQQISPVITYADRNMSANAWLSAADWWQADGEVERYQLTVSMRQTDAAYDAFIQRVGAGAAQPCPVQDALDATEERTFANLGVARRGVRLPSSLLAHTRSVDDALRFAFPHITDSKANAECAVLSVLHSNVRVLNNRALDMKSAVDGLPVRTVSGITTVKDFRGAAMFDEFVEHDALRFEEHTGVPPHDLRLSVGAVCMLTRNVAREWCNGRRVVVRRIGTRSVEVVAAEAWRGHEAHYGEDEKFRVPRIPFQWRKGRLGMTLQRMQFPLAVAYATTFNKSQGKTLQRAVVDVRSPVFAHGQLYVALSRVRRRQDIRLLADARQVRWRVRGTKRAKCAVFACARESA